MNIDGKADYAGSTMRAVRDTVRALHLLSSSCFDREDFDHLFTGVPGTGQAVFAKLLEDGYLKAASSQEVSEDVPSDYRDRPHFVVTLKGGALALASAARPVRRATANKVLKEFLHRLIEIEQDEYYLDVVDEVALFGSMLDPDRDPVGDIDLAVRIVPHRERMAAVGSKFSLELFYRDVSSRRVDPERNPYKNGTDIKKYLKSRKASLSLHELSEDGIIAGLPGVEHRTLYRRGEGLLAPDLL